ncbi:IclR family transcriptional regulator [Leucobacter zeae]|nr:IclR family transcriptional regulator [Leucobacter zeae]
MAGSSRVKSAERTLDVLTVLAQRSAPMTTSEISNALAMPKSTTHHLLNVMQDRFFVHYSREQRVWSLGTAVLEIASAYLRHSPLAQEGHRFLRRLTDRTGATSHTALLQGTDAVYVDKREPQSNGVRLVTEIGSRLPAHTTAVGLAMLGGLDDTRIAEIYAGYDWPSRTGTGPSDLTELLDALGAVRSSGLAVEVGGTTAGISCIACPVRSSGGRTIGAIGVSFMTAAISDSEQEELRQSIRQVGAEFSAALGAPAA